MAYYLPRQYKLHHYLIIFYLSKYFQSYDSVASYGKMIFLKSKQGASDASNSNGDDSEDPIPTLRIWTVHLRHFEF